MPTSTFFNLPDEKREKLILAIKDEFSRVSFDEVSINKIVHAAEIPRGSFYQYFADKNDMLEYILYDYQKQIFEFAKTSLHTSDGDIFNMFADMFDFTVNFVMEEKANSFCKNLFADIKVNTNFYLKMSKNAAEKNMFEELKKSINFEILDLREEKDFENMFEILCSTLRDAITKVFLDILDYKRTKQNYQKQLELMERGFIKKKE